MLDSGSKAPDFVLPDATGRTLSLAGLLEKGPLILYFYPADFTPGCTKEACYIRDIHDDILAVGLQVVGVSPQDAASHTRFQSEHSLPFPLLCDPAKTAIKAYDVDGPLGFGVRRATYLIGQDGVVEDAVLADLNIDRHKTFIEKAISLRENAST
ncbi:MAG: peroxiredoxin [Gammaproteobacteria bacterium]|nr:peroxiredoxin [Gammaproteobacteria bacterium]